MHFKTLLLEICSSDHPISLKFQPNYKTHFNFPLQKDLKNARKRKELPDEARIRSRADPQRMWQLRMMFVNQAKKYFGVPYAKKYWTAEGVCYHVKCSNMLTQALWSYFICRQEASNYCVYFSVIDKLFCDYEIQAYKKCSQNSYFLESYQSS